MKVFITGIAGHIGSRFALWLLGNVADIRIVGVDNLSSGFLENVPDDPRVTFIQGTLGEAMPLEEVIGDAEYVFHFAAYAAEALSPFIRCFDCTNNLVGGLEVLNACLNLGSVKRFVFTSSAAVYGGTAGLVDGAYIERDFRRPRDPYGVTKAAMEANLEIAADQHGLDYCILRPHNLYGPGQNGWQPYRNVIAKWMVRTLEDRPKEIFGDGSQIRAFTYAEDVMPCLWRAATYEKARNQIINLGSSQTVTLRRLAALCNHVCGGRYVCVPPRYEARTIYCTADKAEAVLGQPTVAQETDLETGLAQTWAWMRDAWQRYPDRRGAKRPAPYEVLRGMPDSWKGI